VSCARPSTSSKATDTSAIESLGILGGTFNPPHLGHLAVARHAREELGLERVLLVPASTSPFKARSDADRDARGGGDPGPQHRLAMCRLSVAGEDGLGVSPIEVERGGLSYTVDTLRSIHATHPTAELTFIVGADTARTLGSWREPAELLELAHLAVAARAGSAREGVLDALAAVDGGSVDVRFLEMPAVDVSSSMARHRVQRGEPVDDLVGPAVAAYIAERGLYRVGAGQAAGASA
jgi:nicotinate-nucleotide adenylyltransferase